MTTVTTAATTDGKRPAHGGALKSCALALLLCAAAMLAPPGARAQASSKEELVDSVLTRAGTLTIVRAAPEEGLTLELRLNGKKVEVVDGTMSAGFRAHFRGVGDGEVLVLAGSDGGSGCPAMFRIVRIVEEARVSMTDEFGDCSDSPNITLESLPEERILLRFPGYYRLSAQQEPGFRKPPPTTWVYRKGVLKELKPAARKRR
ncbi:MAG: hypothetical protein ABW250_21920 [Pyrinomonadaceae bacterium]